MPLQIKRAGATHSYTNSVPSSNGYNYITNYSANLVGNTARNWLVVRSGGANYSIPAVTLANEGMYNNEFLHFKYGGSTFGVPKNGANGFSTTNSASALGGNASAGSKFLTHYKNSNVMTLMSIQTVATQSTQTTNTRWTGTLVSCRVTSKVKATEDYVPLNGVTTLANWNTSKGYTAANRTRYVLISNKTSAASGEYCVGGPDGASYNAANGYYRGKNVCTTQSTRSYKITSCWTCSSARTFANSSSSQAATHSTSTVTKYWVSTSNPGGWGSKANVLKSTSSTSGIYNTLQTATGDNWSREWLFTSSLSASTILSTQITKTVSIGNTNSTIGAVIYDGVSVGWSYLNTKVSASVAMTQAVNTTKRISYYTTYKYFN